MFENIMLFLLIIHAAFAAVALIFLIAEQIVTKDFFGVPVMIIALFMDLIPILGVWFAVASCRDSFNNIRKSITAAKENDYG